MLEIFSEINFPGNKGLKNFVGI